MSLPVFHEESERRGVLVPDDISLLKHPEMVFVESGYGDVLGFSNDDYRRAFGLLVPNVWPTSRPKKWVMDREVWREPVSPEWCSL